MRDLIYFIIRPIIDIFSGTIRESEESKVGSSFGLELITFIGGWLATLSLTSIGFRFIERTEWGGSHIVYFLFILLPTAVFYPGIYSWLKDYSNNRLVVMTSSIFLAPLFTFIICAIIILLSRIFND